MTHNYFVRSTKKFQFLITPDELRSVLNDVHFVVANTGVTKDYTESDPSVYRYEKDEQMKYRISNSLFNLRNRKYVPDYLTIVTNDEYGKSYDMIMDILCKYHVTEALPILIKLFEKNPNEWTFAFMRLGKTYHDPIIVPHLQELATHENGEYRALARKALKSFGE